MLVAIGKSRILKLRLNSEKKSDPQKRTLFFPSNKRPPKGGHMIDNKHAYQWCTVFPNYVEFADFINFEAKYTVMYTVLPRHRIGHCIA